jgi:dTMP kinase
MRAVTGALIAFEGLDQSGKETQARRLGQRLEAAGRRVIPLAFPCYTTEIAREIARALKGEREYPPDILQMLYVANRYEYRARIEHWLEQDAVVICDRYLASSIAYGEAQGLDPGWLTAIQRELPQPHVTMLLDIAPQTAVSRKAAGRDRFERDLSLLERVRESYLRLARAPRWCRLDGERPADEIEHDIANVIHERLALPSAP